MRSKTILSTAAFIVAFAASAAFASLFVTKTQTVSDYVPVSGYKSTNCFKYKNNSATADKITALIRQDHINGRESGKTVHPFNVDILWSNDSLYFSYAEVVERYVDLSSNMKAADLPSDFQTEWREHMKAWRDYSEFLNRMKKSSNRAALSGKELKEIDAFHDREITRTWNEVLQTGTNYGADVY